MRRRLAVAIGLGLGLGPGLGCPSAPFECAGDHQCSLAGEPGVCVSGGQCAYPDPDCPSGLSFPLGAMGSQAGQCVPSDGSGTDSGPATASEDVTTGSASPPDPDPSTDATSGAGSVDSGSLCNDPFEPNDVLGEAALISLDAFCLAEWDAFIDDPLDIDWFLLDSSEECSLFEPLLVVTSPPLPVCMTPSCADGSPAIVVECDGQEVVRDQLESCCGTGNLQVLSVCLGETPLMHLSVDGSGEAQCLPYEVAAFF